MKPPKLTITFDLSETADRLREAANALDPQPTSVATRCNHEPLTSCPCADIARNEMLRELMAAPDEAHTMTEGELTEGLAAVRKARGRLKSVPEENA